jgi:opacity protein-like surface antigen
MKNIFTAFVAFAAITAATLSANAQMSGNSSLRALLGFTSSSVNLGGDFEVRQSHLYGVGGYFFMGSDQDGTGNKVTVPEVLAVGGFAPVHLLSDDMIDVYIAPGFGFAKVKYPGTGNPDDTAIGPTLKLGVEYRVAQTVKLGLQYFVVSNWMSDELLDQLAYTSAAATFSF